MEKRGPEFIQQGQEKEEVTTMTSNTVKGAPPSGNAYWVLQRYSGIVVVG